MDIIHGISNERVRNPRMFDKRVKRFDNDIQGRIQKLVH